MKFIVRLQETAKEEAQVSQKSFGFLDRLVASSKTNSGKQGKKNATGLRKKAR